MKCDQFIIDTYKTLTARKQAAELELTYSYVVHRRGVLVKEGKLSKADRAYHPPWTPEQLAHLKESYPNTKMSTLARALKRSEVAITLKKRKMGLYKDSEDYTARTLAGIFGCDSKRLAYLVHEGFLKGRRAAHFRGPYHPWLFKEEQIVAFITQYPWLLWPEKMEQEHYFRAVLREEWDNNPWYTAGQAAKLVGVARPTILRRLLSGELPGFRRSPDKAWSVWWIRRKDLLSEFTRHDTPEQRSRHSSQSMKTRRERAGLPNMLHVIWELVCQHCAERFTVQAAPRVPGPAVAELGKLQHTCPAAAAD